MEEVDKEKISSQQVKERGSSTISEKQLWNKQKALVMSLSGKRLRAQTLEEPGTHRPGPMGKFSKSRCKEAHRSGRLCIVISTESSQDLARQTAKRATQSKTMTELNSKIKIRIQTAHLEKLTTRKD